MSLLPFLNRHAGETAWLFGKGPSLSTFDFKNAGPLRVAINDVIGYVPECKYGFANDGVAKWRDLYRHGQVLFQPVRCLHEFDSTVFGTLACDVVTYQDTGDDARLSLPRAALAELLTIRRGTLGSALQILHVMGVKAVHMVGIDGGGEHADCSQWRTRLRHDHHRDYNNIRNAAIDAAFIMGIALKFHNHDHTTVPGSRSVGINSLYPPVLPCVVTSAKLRSVPLRVMLVRLPIAVPPSETVVPNDFVLAMMFCSFFVSY